MSSSINTFDPGVKAAHFIPFGNFEYDPKHEKTYDEDLNTGDRYHKDHHLRFTMFQVAALGSPAYIVQLAFLTIFRIIKLVTLAHFWLPQKGEKAKSLLGRISAFGADLLRVITAPVAGAAHWLASIYGSILTILPFPSTTGPHNARKLIGSIERAQNFIMFKTFQPYANEWEPDATDADAKELQPVIE